jgi:hypothetical protein
MEGQTDSPRDLNPAVFLQLDQQLISQLSD